MFGKTTISGIDYSASLSLGHFENNPVKGATF